jgi:hypothetical protein
MVCRQTLCLCLQGKTDYDNFKVFELLKKTTTCLSEDYVANGQIIGRVSFCLMSSN